MSDRSFNVGEQTITREMWRRDTQGTLVLVEPDGNEYINLPLDAQGVRGKFELTGISPTYVYDSPNYGQQTKVRLEFLVVKFPGFEALQGKKFTQSYPWPKNIADDRSKLGLLLRALLGRKFDIGESVNPDDFIGTAFVTSAIVEVSQDGQRIYSGISRDGIERRKTELSPHVGSENGTAPQPALVGAAVGATADQDDDPFDEEGDV